MTRMIITLMLMLMMTFPGMAMGKRQSQSGVTSHATTTPPSQSVGHTVNNKAIPFTLADLTGKSVSLENYIGKTPILLVFWASWCPPCRAEVPTLKKWQETYPADVLHIMAVNVASGDRVGQVTQFAEDHAIGYQVLYDRDQTVSRQYQVSGIPTNILIDASGIIRYRGHGLPDITRYLQ